MILNNYLHGSFYIDFLKALPFNIIIIYLCLYKEKYKPDNHFCFFNEKISGFFILIKLLSGLKILNVLKVMSKRKNKAFHRLKEIDNHIFEKLFRLFKFIFLFFASMNVFICLHIFIGNQTNPNWILSMNLQDKPFIKIYIASLYGIIETLTTVGYGDVVCDSFTEIIFQIILLSIGIVAYSFIITIIGNYVNNESKAEIKHSKYITMLEEIRIEFPKMPFKLYNKIKQHFKSVLNQQKKIDLNILINSLPYSIKNMILFKIYNNCINKFIFFKKCDNTDFISRVLTNFIPLFSMKKAILISEGENIENVFFVKTGKLSLNVALDNNNPKNSIKQYIFEKFEDLIDDNKNDNTINDVNGTKDNINDNNNQSMFNQKKQNLTSQSYHESYIEQEIGKCDLGGDDEDIETNYKFLRIMEIKKNEYFGLTYMLLNKPSPLYLRVASKKADIFLLRKHDIISISKAYPTIWKKIREKSYLNMIAIKKKTIKTLKIYCSCKGISLDISETKKTGKINPLNLLEIKELIELEKIKQEEEKKKEKKKEKVVKKPKEVITKKIKSHSLVLNQQKIISNIRNKLINKNCQESSKILIQNTHFFDSNRLQNIQLKKSEIKLLDAL